MAQVSEEHATGELVAQADVLLKQLDALDCGTSLYPVSTDLIMSVHSFPTLLGIV